MEVGLVGKPNVGKSTFFTSATRADVDTASYPFTTIEANKGVGYVRASCPHEELDVECDPNNAPCFDGTRMVPIQIIDVAGLVPEAHKGKGLGNKFLDDLRQASTLIHIIDSSGSTDADGEPCETGEHDPLEDVEFLSTEINHWIKDILEKNWNKVSRRLQVDGGKIEKAVYDQLSGLGVSEGDVVKAIRQTDLPDDIDSWEEKTLLELAKNLRENTKPMILAANKADIAPEENLERLNESGYDVVSTSAEYELALRKATEKDIIDYTPGEESFDLIDDDISDKQKAALDEIASFMERNSGLGVQKTLEKAVYDLLDMIVVYPVEDEHKYTDKDGRVLPDAHLVPRGSTAEDLAYTVHTDIGEGFIRAVDAKEERVIGQDQELKDGDVIKIVSE